MRKIRLDGDGVGHSPWDDWEVVDAGIPGHMGAGAAPPNPPSVVTAPAAHDDHSNPGLLDGVVDVGPRPAQAKKTRATRLLELLWSWFS